MKLDQWQREDGFPSDAYFDAVADALAAVGVDVELWIREEHWEVNYELAPTAYENGPLGWAKHGLYVSWRCEEDDEPKHADDFNGLGWYWVPYSKPDTAGGDFAEPLGLAYLEEPEEVAAAVAELVTGHGALAAYLRSVGYDATKVTGYEQYTYEDGVCDTSHHSEIRVRVDYVDSFGYQDQYEYIGDMAELIRQLTD